MTVNISWHQNEKWTSWYSSSLNWSTRAPWWAPELGERCWSSLHDPPITSLIQKKNAHDVVLGYRRLIPPCWFLFPYTDRCTKDTNMDLLCVQSAFCVVTILCGWEYHHLIFFVDARYTQRICVCLSSELWDSCGNSACFRIRRMLFLVAFITLYLSFSPPFPIILLSSVLSVPCIKAHCIKYQWTLKYLNLSGYVIVFETNICIYFLYVSSLKLVYSKQSHLQLMTLSWHRHQERTTKFKLKVA